MPQNGSHLGSSQSMSASPPFSQSLFRPFSGLCQSTNEKGPGCPTKGSSAVKGSNYRLEGHLETLARLPLSPNFKAKIALRQFRPWVGRPGSFHRKVCARILAPGGLIAYKRKRIEGCSGHSAKSGQAQQQCSFVGGQSGDLPLSKEGRGEDSLLQCNFEALSKVVCEPQSSFIHTMGSLSPHVGRSVEQVDIRSRGLHLTPPFVSVALQKFQRFDYSRSGLLCLPRKLSASKVYSHVASPSSLESECAHLQSERGDSGLCQPPLDPTPTVALQAQGGEALEMSPLLSLLGFSKVVAPINKTSCSKKYVLSHFAFSRHVPKLLGTPNGGHQVAPPLHLVVRQLLEKQEMSPESINHYMEKITSWARYQSAFQLLWDQLAPLQLPFAQLSLPQVANAVIAINRISPAQARNAYAAALLIPGWSQLRFEPGLQPFKRQWNSNVEKYSTFWSPTALLKTLVDQPLPPCPSVSTLRDRLILCCKLLLLHRSVDLSRVLRTTSVVDGIPFLLVQRKGWRQHKWEKILSLPHLPHVSPWHLIVQYVQATSHLVPEGSPLVLALHKPYKALSSNAIASLTKRLLQKHGIDTTVWGAHSTRGAAVLLYKELGLNSEEVCELGKWRNFQAFSSHYLRVGAIGRAQELLTKKFLCTKSHQGLVMSTTCLVLPGKQGLTREEETRSAKHKALVRSPLLLPAVVHILFLRPPGPFLLLGLAALLNFLAPGGGCEKQNFLLGGGVSNSLPLFLGSKV